LSLHFGGHTNSCQPRAPQKRQTRHLQVGPRSQDPSQPCLPNSRPLELSWGSDCQRRAQAVSQTVSLPTTLRSSEVVFFVCYVVVRFCFLFVTLWFAFVFCLQVNLHLKGVPFPSQLLLSLTRGKALRILRAPQDEGRWSTAHKSRDQADARPRRWVPNH